LTHAFSACLGRAIIPVAAQHGTLPSIHRFAGSSPAKKPKKGKTMLVAIIRFLQSWRRYNASLRELYQLGDRELADIGISRSDIPRIAWDAADRKLP
jgi:uncharacterized protein YjiS (DUF1127 family)